MTCTRVMNRRDDRKVFSKLAVLVKPVFQAERVPRRTRYCSVGRVV
jgi:hypothetical protein